MPFSIIRKILICTILIYLGGQAKSQSYILPNAYAHNDYWHKRPLFDALDNGFTYVEADVYLRRGKLIVAHILPFLSKNRTLEDTYLKPLAACVADTSRNDAAGTHPLTLMIDIKSGGNETYTALKVLLSKYQHMLSAYKDGKFIAGRVTIVITGHKPAILNTDSSDRFVFMDENLKKADLDSTANMYRVASCKYSSLLKWKGKGTIRQQDLSRLKYYVAEAHKNGRKVRLWGSPERKMVWAELLKCNVDLINTNRLVSLRKFLVSDKLAVANTN
ncbi:MAG: phosphatidylinositol-specific phospholipase C/glycerophosphodiester phosphodiesterase family protein [Ferruginibacter sp.]